MSRDPWSIRSIRTPGPGIDPAEAIIVGAPHDPKAAHKARLRPIGLPEAGFAE